ncbi:unnamed protein product [Fraxinus pennsylvanica]|uniref:Uncharacterized protein n=1 Tax=Fraxinus pennsylvanica TaxID=56036 RepID=A0AAD1ZL70_9LAMI|nr:unnamed protein product [Fraxinus pennsylvanica]
MVTDICRKEPYLGMNPLEAAVCMAALEGAVVSSMENSFGSLDLFWIQTTPMSIGIQANGNSIEHIIPKNTTLQAERSVLFKTVHDNQPGALIIVYEGDEKEIENNHTLRYFKITGITPARKGARVIEVCMRICALNVLTVSAGLLFSSAPAMQVLMPMEHHGHRW